MESVLESGTSRSEGEVWQARVKGFRVCQRVTRGKKVSENAENRGRCVFAGFRVGRDARGFSLVVYKRVEGKGKCRSSRVSVW